MGETAVPRVAIAGLGGFAGNHHSVIKSLEEEGVCKLVSTCDPNPAGQQTQIQKFDLIERQVRLHEDFNAMLEEEADSIDVVLLPTPIPLHAEQHRRVIELGKACYLEKPPTLWWPEFQQMLEVEKQAKWQTQIGFNFVGDPFRRRLKERLLSGEFGQVLGATLIAIWPRDLAYYQRNNWAGKMQVDGKPVMDSPIGNACAHFVQDLLFWLGSGDVDSVMDISQVRANLTQAHPIESFDTVMLEALSPKGQWLRMGVTHTELEDHRDCETIYCKNATITLDSWWQANIEYKDGRSETLESDLRSGTGPLGHNLKTYFAYLQGTLERPGTNLAESKSFVQLQNLAFKSAGIIENEDGEIERQDGKVRVPGLEDRLSKFVLTGDWPFDTPTTVTPTDL